jgi:CHAT domain-containing protein/tetratricopeptide (TPR) repeat protein
MFAAGVLAMHLTGVAPVLAQQQGNGPAPAAQASADPVETLNKRSKDLFAAGHYEEALAAAEEWAQAFQQSGNAKGKPEAVASTLNAIAWRALFAKQFGKALEMAAKATELQPASLSPQANYAHALMFLGRTEAAMAAYGKNKGKGEPKGRKWEDIVWKDFANFEKAGLTHPAMAQVREALVEPVETLNKHSQDSFVAGRYEEALALAEEWARAFQQSGTGEDKPEALPSVLCDVAWRALFARRFDRALELAAKAVKLYPNNIKPQSGHAYALMFSGRTEEALAIFAKYKGTATAEGLKWEDWVLKDLATMEKRGLTHPAMAQVKEVLAAPAVPRPLPEQAQALVNDGKFAEALPLLEKHRDAVKAQRGENHPEYAEALKRLAQLHAIAGRHAQAEPLLRQALDIEEKAYGAEDLRLAGDFENLGGLLTNAGRYAEAETVLRRALSIYEKKSGPEHPDTAVCLKRLGTVLKKAKRLEEAEALFRRAVKIGVAAQGPEHPETVDSLNQLAVTLFALKRYAEAEPLARQILAAREKAYGAEHPNLTTPIQNLATLLQETGRFVEAEALFRRHLGIVSKAYGPDHAETGKSLNNLAVLFGNAGHSAEAVPLMQRALGIQEKAQGADHPALTVLLNNLGKMLIEMSRYAEAETVYRRALAICERKPCQDYINEGMVLGNLGESLLRTGRISEAEAVFRRALAIDEKRLGREAFPTAREAGNLAVALSRQGRHAEAEPLLRQSLETNEKILGPDHFDVGVALSQLSVLYVAMNRLSDAEPPLSRAIAIHEKLGRQDRYLAEYLSTMAVLKGKQGDWPSALQYIRRATSTYVAVAREMRDEGVWRRQLMAGAERFQVHVAIAYHAAHADPAVFDEAFAMAQRATASEAGNALEKAVARFAAGNNALAALVREQQDLTRRASDLDKRYFEAVGQAGNGDAAEVQASLEKLRARLSEIGAQLARDFPDYVGLASPEPLTVAQIQALLAPDEVFVQFLDFSPSAINPLPDAVFAFAITKTEVRWLALPIGAKELKDAVAALRCGLDSSNWAEQRGVDLEESVIELKKNVIVVQDKRYHCTQLLGKTASEQDLPPFDLARAHKLYLALFGEIQDLIKDKRLLIAPSGPLSGLPFQALVTEAPEPADQALEAYAKAHWLGAHNAITVTPSAAGLRLLRMAKRSVAGKAREPFMGFGNPLLGGEGTNDRRAWQKQECSKAEPVQPGQRSASRAIAQLARLNRGGVADVEGLRQAMPLPETADELCAVAHKAGAPDSAVFLGERATVSVIKALSASGALARAKAVHFATHGLLARETAQFTRGQVEPALLMTPPAKEKASAEDDGLLKASDVTQLKLNADWVVMSACNTAAGEKGGEALSGLARAFFYAGARSILVSHWYVQSEAAVEITTGAFAALEAEPGIGRDEALRRSLVSLIAKGGAFAHPSVWAPFVLVGDGGRLEVPQ